MSPVISAVRKLRAALGLTQPAFANRLGLSIRAIAYYEKEREPNGEILRRLGSLAARNGRDDLAKVFYDAFARETEGKTAPATPQETAWVQAILLLLRNRDTVPSLRQISADAVAALE